MIWMNSLVWPPLACRTVSTSLVRPGTNRSWPILSSGPLRMSLIPVASTTRAPGRPRANRSYQASTSGVTSPSSVARHGTMAGTQVRCSSVSGPTCIGLNHREPAASASVGHRATGISCLMGGSGCHMEETISGHLQSSAHLPSAALPR